jgi:hypothetical protein
MVKINFDKYDASCKDNVWSWNIPNRNNTKNIKVVVKFEPGISFPTSTVEDMYFEENEDFIITYEDINKEKLDYKKLYIELTEKILKYDHNSYGYIENYNEKYEEYEDLQPGTDGFLSDEQLSYIQDSFKDSSEIYKIIKDVYKHAPQALTDFNRRRNEN